MTQYSVERTIGKLATDAEFRNRFFANPGAATWEAGLPLSPVELEALSGLPRTAVTRFSESLDARITRLCLDMTNVRALTERSSGDDAQPEPERKPRQRGG